MKYCIICKEEDMDVIEDHHTVPRSIIPEWNKTVPLCQKCHKKIHKYILGDLTDIVSAIRESYDQMNKTFKSVGFIDNINFPTDGLHRKIHNILFSNIPTITGMQKEISIGKIVKLCGLDPAHSKDPSGRYYPSNQKIGYALKKMGINAKHKDTGKWVIYDRKTIDRLYKLHRIFENLTN